MAGITGRNRTSSCSGFPPPTSARTTCPMRKRRWWTTTVGGRRPSYNRRPSRTTRPHSPGCYASTTSTAEFDEFTRNIGHVLVMTFSDCHHELLRRVLIESGVERMVVDGQERERHDPGRSLVAIDPDMVAGEGLQERGR